MNGDSAHSNNSGGDRPQRPHYLKCPLLHPRYWKGNFLFYSILTPPIFSIWCCCCVIQCSCCSCIIAQQSLSLSLPLVKWVKTCYAWPWDRILPSQDRTSLLTFYRTCFFFSFLIDKKGVLLYTLIWFTLSSCCYVVRFSNTHTHTHVGASWHHRWDVCA